MLILVIDDDELSRELLTLLLEVEGYTVVSAAFGDEGLSLLGEMDPQPEAVLTDLQMPGISGTELAHALRALLSPGIPVIAMSGSDSRPPGTLAGTPPGFDGFLLKPFPAADLRKVLADAGTNDKVGLDDTVTTTANVEAEPAIVPEDEAEPALNEEVFLKMQELMPPMQLGQMYELCIADARTRIAAMRSFADAGDAAGYRSEAHAIKGGAGMIGAVEIYKLSTMAEQRGLASAEPEQGDSQFAASAGTSGVTASLDQLSRACERLERILMERLHP